MPEAKILSAACALVLIAETAEYRANRTSDAEAQRTLLDIRRYAVAGLKQLKPTADSTVSEHSETRSES